MCFPTFSEIEVEERQPRYPGEPRRKRLRLIKDPIFKNFEEGTLIRSYPESLQGGQEWDQEQAWRRRLQQQQQQQQHQQQQLEQQWQHQQLQRQQQQQWQHHQLQQQYHQNQQPLHEQRWQSSGFHPQSHIRPDVEHMQHPGIPGPAMGRIQQNPQQNFDNGIQRVEEWSPGNQGHHLNHVEPRLEEWKPGNQGNHLNHVQPRLIEAAPRARLPHYLRTNSRRHKSKSPGRSGHNPRRDSSTDSDDTEDSSIWHGRRLRQSEIHGFDPYDSFEDLRRPRPRSRSARRVNASRR